MYWRNEFIYWINNCVVLSQIAYGTFVVFGLLLSGFPEKYLDPGIIPVQILNAPFTSITVELFCTAPIIWLASILRYVGIPFAELLLKYIMYFQSLIILHADAVHATIILDIHENVSNILDHWNIYHTVVDTSEKIESAILHISQFTIADNPVINDEETSVVPAHGIVIFVTVVHQL